MQIEQLLNGYNQGHNLLAASVHLSSTQDVDRIAILSDWTEFTDPYSNDSSYITAYPLVDCNYYAVAKTWYAPEMERPGCVWTHTLLINLNDILPDFDFRNLMSMFCRPEKGRYESYFNPILINPNESISNDFLCKEYDLAYLLFLYANLVALKIPFIARMEQTSAFYQKLCLSLMQYLPVGFLCTKSFSTGSVAPRKIGNTPFSLQIATSTGASLLNTPITTDIKPESYNQGLRYILTALRNGNSQISRLLRLFSNDITDDHDKLYATGNLLRLLDEAISQKQQIGSYKVVLDILLESFSKPDEGVLLKQKYLSHQISSLFCSDSELFYELCSTDSKAFTNHKLFSFENRVEYLATAVALRKDYLGLLSRLSESNTLNEEGNYILSNAPSNLTDDDIKQIAESDWNLYLTLLLAEHKILNNSAWLSFPRDKFVKVWEIFQNVEPEGFMLWDKLLEALLCNECTISYSISLRIVAQVQDAVRKIMDYANGSESRRIHSALSSLCKTNQEAILSWMSSQNSMTCRAANIVMNSIDPQSLIVKKTGSPSWLAFSYLRDDSSFQIGYYIYMYLLSCNWATDKNAILYLKTAFYPIYCAARDGQLDFQDWVRIVPYTEQISFLLDWDHCKRLRKTVVKRLKNAGYRKEFLLDFTPSKEVNNDLLRVWEKK